MKKLSKLTTLALAGVMVLSLAACGGTNGGAASSPAPGTGAPQTGAPAKIYKIGIIQQLEHQALDAATEGFRAAMTELLGEGNVEFDYQNAQNDQNNCTTIATKFVADKVDLIMANATTALQASASATGEIPIVGTSVTDFKTAGVVDSNDAPGRNVTGTSDLAPIDQQIELLLELCPEAKTVGIIYCSAEANSLFQAEKAQGYLEAAGIAVKTYTVADSNEIQSVVSKASDEVDVLYIPTDNTMADNMELVKNIMVPKGIPTFCAEENMTRSGGLATLSISYFDVGYTAGEMAYEILVNGAKPAEMPIQFVPDVVKKYNADVAEALKMTMPEGFEPIT